MLLVALNTIQVILLVSLIIFLLVDYLNDHQIEHARTLLTILFLYSILAATDFFASASPENLNVALDFISNSDASVGKSSRADGGHPAPSAETLMKSHSVFDDAAKKKILNSVERTKGSEEEILAASRKSIEQVWSKSEHGKVLDVSVYDPKGKRP
jgi:hypothetical protein